MQHRAQKRVACDSGFLALPLLLVSVPLVAALHVQVDLQARRLHVLHVERTQCRKGCHGCCADDLTVFDVEAGPIRAQHAELLAHGVPAPAGGCAFLDAAGACRIYDERPYVCRTQGLPLRWLADDEVELRDICPLNDVGVPIEELAADSCWTLGPTEESLAHLQLAADPAAPRTSLRSLFALRR